MRFVEYVLTFAAEDEGQILPAAAELHQQLLQRYPAFAGGRIGVEEATEAINEEGLYRTID